MAASMMMLKNRDADFGPETLTTTAYVNIIRRRLLECLRPFFPLQGRLTCCHIYSNNEAVCPPRIRNSGSHERDVLSLIYVGCYQSIATATRPYMAIVLQASLSNKNTHIKLYIQGV